MDRIFGLKGGKIKGQDESHVTVIWQDDPYDQMGQTIKGKHANMNKCMDVRVKKAMNEDEKEKTDEEKKLFHDVIDEDLYETFTDEEIMELVEEGRIKALQKAEEEKNQKPTSRFPKWVIWLIAIGMIFNLIALIPQTYSIPAVKFLSTSASLSTQDDIQIYKKAVVVIETDESKGTGFSFMDNGSILTNYHVIEGNKEVSVTFPEAGMYRANVVETYPDIDLAVLEMEGKPDELPTLDLADHFELNEGESIYFIGNPLKFTGIANKGTVLDYTNVASKEKPVVMMEAPVYRGNSGSPVIDESGKVIGVVFATLRDEEVGRVGLFIPIDYLYEARQESDI